MVIKSIFLCASHFKKANLSKGRDAKSQTYGETHHGGWAAEEWRIDSVLNEFVHTSSNKNLFWRDFFMLKSQISLVKNVRNVLTTSVIATTFAFTSVTGQAYADNHELDPQVEETVEEEQTNEPSTEEEAVSTEDATNEETTELISEEDENDGATEVETEDTTTEVATDESEDQIEEDTAVDTDVESPSLIPGDFFYFIKILLENIQLALTFDNVKEAELLASFAEERIKEVEVLLANGEEDLAHEVLLKAIEQQELALAKYEQTEQKTEETPAEDQVETVENDTIEETDEISTIEDENKDTNEEDQEKDNVEPTRAALEAKFSANILALTAALEKIENPKAKEVLQRNITKAQEKLEKKIDKKLNKLEEKKNKPATDNETATEAETAPTNLDPQEEGQGETAELTNKVVITSTIKAQDETNKKVVESEREALKKQQEADKKAAELEREALKKQQEADKKAAELEREALKKQQEADKKAEEHKREENKKPTEDAGKRADEDKKDKNPNKGKKE